MKSYLVRFNQVTLEIKSLPQVVTMHSILVDLKFGDFSKSLAKRLVETMIELLAHSNKFINMEEMEAAKRQVDAHFKRTIGMERRISHQS